ncbi:hypothetical protein BJ508DRAFT_315705 [Ascobolus immersus RN42]|uniref:Uncharacterized protein n=1 Tax=Ascobolus immersus RN42 TaxID=1160509 RepID=A0A3N4H9K1_ASCIM|nr:hypothetical protein BJ508DRAFT_315705 [Ascobolus immersus RN42]
MDHDWDDWDDTEPKSWARKRTYHKADVTNPGLVRELTWRRLRATPHGYLQRDREKIREMITSRSSSLAPASLAEFYPTIDRTAILSEEDFKLLSSAFDIPSNVATTPTEVLPIVLDNLGIPIAVQRLLMDDRMARRALDVGGPEILISMMKYRDFDVWQELEERDPHLGDTIFTEIAMYLGVWGGDMDECLKEQFTRGGLDMWNPDMVPCDGMYWDGETEEIDLAEDFKTGLFAMLQAAEWEGSRGVEWVVPEKA